MKKAPEPISSARVMKVLRTLMSRELSTQERLERIVRIISRLLRMDVCSCYILRPGDILELVATHGLDPQAVHDTFLRVGEGLIGEIALQRKPLSFENAWEHSSFVYKPATKERPFKSLAGVPLIRGNRLLGVLAVQTKKVQDFPPDIMELLETIAMVITEMLAADALKPSQKETPIAQSAQKAEGITLIEGFALGYALVHRRADRVMKILAKDASGEVKRLNMALARVEEEVNNILTQSHVTEDQTDIFETYLMFLQDKGWIAKMTKAIDSGLTAEAAVQKVGEEITDRMALITDPYIRERIHDFKDLISRLMRHLRKKSAIGKKQKLAKNTILIAESLGPAELLDYDRRKIKGIVLEEGSQTMHVVIVARALNIPLICGTKNICKIVSGGDMVALDATGGCVYLNPSDETLDELSARVLKQKKLHAKYAQVKNLPAITKDGFAVSLNINVGLSQDLFLSDETFFDGIGLYRTELPFMLTEELPSIQKQTDIYHRILLQARGKPLVFRTLDIGSDKALPYLQHRNEENPAMGWRSIRMTLDRRMLLRNQLRALIRATAGHELRLMFPMVSDADEFIAARQTLRDELARAGNCGQPLPSPILVGTMLEVPALIFQLERLLDEVDFISIGTNDLFQFIFAADRGNSQIWSRYDALSPAFLRALKHINDTCLEKGIPCAVCGEMAGKPLEACVLAGLGFRSLSMNPASVNAVKAAIRSADQKQLADFLETQLSSAAHSLREKLKLYARDHGILI